MIELRQHKRDMDFTSYDYIFEDSKKFEEVLPYLTPKLDGTWSVLLIEPKLAVVRTYLDTSLIPSYVMLVITLEGEHLSQLYLERPQLEEKELSNWDIYMNLIRDFPVPMDDKALREIYFRCGPNEASLKSALSELVDYSYINMQVVNKHFAPVNRVYASQVVRAFLLGNFKTAWRMLPMLEQEVGSTIAFYAMRKNIRKVFTEKNAFLRNEDTHNKLVEMVDGYTIVLLYWLFETATDPKQLYPLLQMFERRQPPC